MEMHTQPLEQAGMVGISLHRRPHHTAPLELSWHDRHFAHSWQSRDTAAELKNILYCGRAEYLIKNRVYKRNPSTV